MGGSELGVSGLEFRVPGFELRVPGWEGQSSERESSQAWDDMAKGAVELAVASRLSRIHVVEVIVDVVAESVL